MEDDVRELVTTLARMTRRLINDSAFAKAEIVAMRRALVEAGVSIERLDALSAEEHARWQSAGRAHGLTDERDDAHAQIRDLDRWLGLDSGGSEAE